MKIVFISNALDHIQIPLCDEFFNQTNDQFYYIAMGQSSSIRSDITATDINKSKPYVIRPYESPSEDKRAKNEIENADVVILGSAPEEYVKERILANKLTFRYMERLYKTPFSIRNAPHRIVSAILHHSKYKRKQLHMLCAGAYAAYDHNLFGNYRGKRYVWGYFPAFQPHNVEEYLNQKKQNSVTEIVWVGRFVGLKHPEQVVELAKYLASKQISFHINMIGYGELLESCQKAVQKENLKQLDVLGPKSPEEVRAFMDKANILLFTSDREEGWGAVVNEGMNSLCAVVASASAGVSPYLVTDGVNGFLYDCNVQDSLNRKVEHLILDKELCERFAIQGYQTIKDYWNPQNAVCKFVELADSIQNHSVNPVHAGPCSPAPIIKDGWYKDE